jgi:hypothetical protein
MPGTFQVSEAVLAHASPAELGVLVCERQGRPPFAESCYVKRLSVIGKKLGIRLFAFAPWTWNPRDDSVKGWIWNEKLRDWKPARRKLPSVVYDRAWPDSEEEKLRYRRALKTVQAAKRLVFLNGMLPHKGKVCEMLARDRALSAYLPPTAIYEGIPSLASWLRKHNRSAFLKPVAGSQGKRVLAVTLRQDGTVALTGRDGRFGRRRARRAVRRTPGKRAAGGDRRTVFVDRLASGTNFWEIRRNRFGLRNRTERQALVSGSQLQARSRRHGLRRRRSSGGSGGAASVLCQIHLASTTWEGNS